MTPAGLRIVCFTQIQPKYIPISLVYKMK